MLLCGLSTEHAGWRIHFETTKDLGKSRRRIGPINDASKSNAIQPTVLTHSDGRLQVLCRTRASVIAQSWFRRCGKTWSPLSASNLPNPSAGIAAVTLKNGRHLLVYNHTIRRGPCPRGREMLNVVVTDDGENWKTALMLENQKGEHSYPVVIQTVDGLVRITYTYLRRKVKHVVVDPAKLKLVDIRQGQWPGLVRSTSPD